MNWLSPYHAMTITLAMIGIPIIEWEGSLSHSMKRVILFLKARLLVERGCLDYWDIFEILVMRLLYLSLLWS